MRSFPKVGVYLDTRSKLKNGEYPIKLRVTFQRSTNYFKTNLTSTKQTFEKATTTTNPRGVNRVLNQKIEFIKLKANETIEKMAEFTFSEFSKHFYQTSYEKNDVVGAFFEYINVLLRNEKFSTAENYLNAINKLYFTIYPTSQEEEKEIKVQKNYREIPFTYFTPETLYDIQRKWDYLSPSTQGMYFRDLRTVFNQAITKNQIPQSIYPFGKGRFSPPKSRNTKLSLTPTEVKSFMNFDVGDKKHLAKAKDFWLLCFYLNGININDLLRFKFKDLEGNFVNHFRSKTKTTSDTIIQRKIRLVPKAIEIINLYKRKIHSDNEYLFPTLSSNMSANEKNRQVKVFTRFMNQHLATLSNSIGLKKKITTNSARHSFASLTMHKTKDIHLLKDVLGHSDIRTTELYISSLDKGFDEDFFKEILA